MWQDRCIAGAQSLRQRRSMNSIQIALAVIAGICIYVGIYHALVGLRRRPVDGLEATR